MNTYYLEYGCNENGVLSIRCDNLQKLYNFVKYLNDCRQKIVEKHNLEDPTIWDEAAAAAYVAEIQRRLGLDKFL